MGKLVDVKLKKTVHERKSITLTYLDWLSVIAGLDTLISAGVDGSSVGVNGSALSLADIRESIMAEIKQTNE